MAEIQWGSIADWVSGIGSLSAAAVALHIAYASRRIKLRATCGHRLVIGLGRSSEDVFSVSATNISQRPTVITGVGFTFGLWRWKKRGFFNFTQTDLSHGIPRSLADGETGQWIARLGPNNRWTKDFREKFSISWWSVFTWRVHIYTSNGGTTTIRPEKNIRDMLFEETSARKSK